MTSNDSRIKKVLILDDEPCVLRTLAEYLKAPDLLIVTCSEIEAAECLLARERFDVLVTDLEVSVFGGLEGIRLIRHARVHFPDLAVLVFSGKLTQEVRDLGMALGVTELLEKPTELARLQELIAATPARQSDGAPKVAGMDGGDVSHIVSLDEILATRCISAVLQPIVNLDPMTGSSATLGFEGLARGPQGSLLRDPELLLGYAARKERLFDVELQCIEAVLEEASHLPTVGKLFINVRPRSLSSPGFCEILGDLVERYGFKRTDIVLELTEQQSILNLEAFDATLSTLRDRGFGLALDDFGNGFANLHLVGELPLDYLKIDGFFCRDVESNQTKQKILRSTFEMAEKLGISTIMERVETESELEVVMDLGALYAQGYYFCRPVLGKDLAHSYHLLPATSVQKAASNFDSVESLPPEGAEDSRQHELSNLLTAIALYSAQGMKRLRKDDPLYDDLREILSASEQAVALSEN